MGTPKQATRSHTPRRAVRSKRSRASHVQLSEPTERGSISREFVDELRRVGATDLADRIEAANAVAENVA